MEGLNQSRANLVVYLHPSKASSPSDAILGELSSLLFTYNESLDGVVLAYDPKISSNLAHIVPGITPNLGVQLRADLLMFSPKPDMLVEGEVVSITSHAINAVVLGFASASIDREDVRGEFRFRSGKGEYVSRLSKKHKLRVGTVLRFRVKCFDGETLHVTGSMVGEDTGCVRWLDRNVDAWNRVERSDVKRKIGEVKDEEEMVLNDVEVKRSKKSKRSRVREEDNKEMPTLLAGDERPKNVKLEGNGKEEFRLDVKKEMPSLKDGEKSKKSKKARVREEQDNKEEKEEKSKNIKLEEFGLEAKEEMQSLKECEKSKKSEEARVKEEQDNKEENGLVKNQEISSLKEDAKPKKSKKKRKE